MKKAINKKMLAICVASAALFLLPLASSAGDKLLVKDSTAATKFTVNIDDATDEVKVGVGTATPAAVLDISPSGTITTDALKVNATDTYNSFQYKVQGHTGGVSHVQITTDQSDGRLSLLGGAADDFAPRFQAVGANDSEAPQVAGWALFDYGSHLYDLPNATFKIRHVNTAPTGFTTDMLSCIGTTTVSVPSANVGIGTTAPASKLAVAGLPTSPPDASGNHGAVCITNDGNMWVDDDGVNDCL